MTAIDICNLATVRSLDLSQYSGVITIEEPDTDDPFRTNAVPQLVLQFHDIDMTMLGYVEPEPEHVQKALTFARETDGPLLVHCRAGISRSPAIALAIASDRFGSGNEQQAYHWLLEVCPHAQPNRLAVHWIDQVLSADHALSNSIFGVAG
jgi:predicted protein tyrosine phosphatase